MLYPFFVWISMPIVVYCENNNLNQSCQMIIFLCTWFLPLFHSLSLCMCLRGQAQYCGVFPLSIYSFIPVAGKKKWYLIDKIYCGTPVSIAEQIYLLCGQQPPHRFLASILVPLFLKYWLTPGLESYLTNESMYGRRGREEEGRSLRG